MRVICWALNWTAWFFIEWAFTKFMPIDAVSARFYDFGNRLYQFTLNLEIKHGLMVRNPSPFAGEYPEPIWIKPNDLENA